MYTKIIDLDNNGSYRLYCRLRNKTLLEQETIYPALLFVPGGGFCFSDPTDQEAMIYKFMSCNYHVFTYTYAVGPDYRFPDVVIYLSKALKLIRDHAAEWNVDPHKIAVGGCSAGAFITAALGGLWNRSMIQEPAGCSGTENRPDLMMLCYGPLYCNQQTKDGLLYVPTGDLVGPHTPPAFVAHCGDDTSVPVDQSLAYAAALCKAGVPLSVFISGNGDHGGLQNVRGLINKKNQLTVTIDDWFPAFLKFADNEFGTSPVPAPVPIMLPPDMLPEGQKPEDLDPDEIPVMVPPTDANGNMMGTFAADLKLGFNGAGDESFDNVLH